MQSTLNLVNSESSNARGSKFERQRYAVEPRADSRDRRRVVVGQRESQIRTPCAIDEQLNGFRNARDLTRRGLEWRRARPETALTPPGHKVGRSRRSGVG